MSFNKRLFDGAAYEIGQVPTELPLLAYVLVVDTQSFSVTPSDVTLTQTFFDYPLVIDTTTFVVTPNDTGFLRARRLSIDAGAYAGTYNAVNLVRARVLQISTRTYSVLTTYEAVTVLEGFEALNANNAPIGYLTWDDPVAPSGMSLSTSNVTQGTYSLRKNGGLLFLSMPNFFTLGKAFTKFSIDYTQTSTGFNSDGYFQASLSNPSGPSPPTREVRTTLANGTYTNTIDFSDYNVQPNWSGIFAIRSTSGGTSNVYYDNLRGFSQEPIDHPLVRTRVLQIDTASYGVNFVDNNLKIGYTTTIDTQSYVVVTESETLLESFDNASGGVPTGGTITWTNSVPGPTPARPAVASTEWFTEGTASAKFAGTYNDFVKLASSVIDLSAYDQIKLDYNIVSTYALTYFDLVIFGSASPVDVYTNAGETGIGTLVADITALEGKDAAYIWIANTGGATADPTEAITYVDNLRGVKSNVALIYTPLNHYVFPVSPASITVLEGVEETVLEGFETLDGDGLPTGGSIVWDAWYTPGGGSTLTTEANTVWKTEGDQSLRAFTSTPSYRFQGLQPNDNLDLRGASYLLFDYNTDQSNEDGYIYGYAGVGFDDIDFEVYGPATGTLLFDLTSFVDADKEFTNFYFGFNSGGGVFSSSVDNLRKASGALKFNRTFVYDLFIDPATVDVTNSDVEFASGKALPIDTQTVLVDTNDSQLFVTRTFSIEDQTYDVVNSDVILSYGFTLGIDSQSYTVDTVDVEFIRNTAIAVDQQSYAVQANNVNVNKTAYRLAVETQSYTVEAQGLGFNSQRYIVLDSIDVEVQPSPIGLLHDKIVPVDAQTYEVTPIDFGMNFGFTFVVDTTEIDVVASEVLFDRETRLPITTRAYTVAPNQVGLRATRLVQVDANSYTVVNNDVDLEYGRALSITRAQYTVTRNPVNLLRQKAIFLDALELAVDAFDVDLRKTTIFAVDPVGYDVVFNDLESFATRMLGVDTAPISVDTFDVTFDVERFFYLDTAQVEVTNYDLILYHGNRTLPVDVGAFDVTFNDVNIFPLYVRRLQIETSAYIVEPQEFVFNYTRRINVTPADYVVDPQAFRYISVFFKVVQVIGYDNSLQLVAALDPSDYRLDARDVSTIKIDIVVDMGEPNR